jgi:hypothetical protein
MVNDPNLFDEDAAWTERLRPLREPVAPEPRPFLYTRLAAQLQTTVGPGAPWWLRRPALAGSLALFVLGLNAAAAVRYARQVPATPPPATRYAAFVADYQLDPFYIPHE